MIANIFGIVFTLLVSIIFAIISWDIYKLKNCDEYHRRHWLPYYFMLFLMNLIFMIILIIKTIHL